VVLMKNLLSLLGTFVICVLLIAGCADRPSPIDLDLSPKTSKSELIAPSSQTHLWGYYDVYFDLATRTMTAIDNRQAMFTANVVNFLNNKPSGLGFSINNTQVTPDYVSVDIDVSITHPFPGLPQYNGYDVRGIFMGDGSASLNYNPDLIYPVLGTDQFMLADPVDGNGAPDGYTRWFNKAEFSTGGLPLFQFTQGKIATPGYNSTSTLNPYKYYADGLAVSDDLWTWLQANPSMHSVFSTGVTNKRNYYLRFPTSKGIKFGYAIIANWEGTEPQYHPYNTPESIACKDVNTSDLWFVSPTQNGGNIKLDVSIWNWKSAVSAGAMEDYKLFIESTVLSSVHSATSTEMTPIGGDSNFSTYHVEIPADNITGTDSNEYWVIVEQNGLDYTNKFGVGNLADTDPLAAFFRNDLQVGNQPLSWITVTSPNGSEIWDVDSLHDITWQSSPDITDIKIEYSKDNFIGDIHEIIASTPNDGVYGWTVPDDPSDTVRVRISNVSNPSTFDISDNYFTIQPVSTDCGVGIHDTLQYVGTYALNLDQTPNPTWFQTYDIASLPDGRILMQGFSGGMPALMAFDVTQNGLSNGQDIITNQWTKDTFEYLMSMDVCEITGNIVFILESNSSKMLVFDSSGKHVDSIASTHDVYAAVDTDWDGGIWTVEYDVNSDSPPMGIAAFLEHYVWNGTTYTHNPADSLEITSDLELNPIKVTEIGIVFSAKRLILLEHSSYPWKGNMYNYDLSAGKPALMPALTQKQFLSTALSESQINHWRKAFDIEIDHTNLSKEKCRILLGRRTGLGWDDGSYFTRYDIDMNKLAEYHVPGNSSNAHLLESFALCKNPNDPDGIFLTIQEGWLSHPNMDQYEVYKMPVDW
jgi:hypothetical protein